jgi:hypothetical protein
MITLKLKLKMSDMRHSAYRSMQLAKQNKTENKDGGLRRWINEKWRNLTPLTLGDPKFYECGKKSKEQQQKNLPSICRPTITVNKDTPMLASNYNLKQLKKAVSIKKRGGRIMWDEL